MTGLEKDLCRSCQGAALRDGHQIDQDIVITTILLMQAANGADLDAISPLSSLREDLATLAIGSVKARSRQLQHRQTRCAMLAASGATSDPLSASHLLRGAKADPKTAPGPRDVNLSNDQPQNGCRLRPNWITSGAQRCDLTHR